MRRPIESSAGSANRRPSTFSASPSSSGKSRRGTSWLHRKTRRDRMRAKLKEIKEELRRRMHRADPRTRELAEASGHRLFAYHAVPTNFRALLVFRAHVKALWYAHAPATQSEGPHDWARMLTARRRLPPATPHPSSLAEPALRRHPPKVGAVCGKAARTALCGGRPVMGVPTAIAKRNHLNSGCC